MPTDAPTAAPTEASPDRPGDGRERLAADVFRAPADGFAIRFPAGWEIRENEFGLRVSALRPERNGEEHPISVDVRLERVPPGVEVTIEQWARAVPEAVGALFPGASIKSRTFTRLSGRKALQYEFTAEDRGTPVRVMETTVIGNGRVYTISYVAGAQQFRQHRRLAERVTQSFRLL